MFEGLGNVVGGVFNWFGAEQQNRRQADAAEQANAFSANQFASRYQTTVNDMKAAGLNPMLAYSQGGGSPPSGQQANVPANSGASAFQGYQQSKLNNAQADLLEAQKEAASAQAEKTRAETPQVPWLAEAEIMHKKASAGAATTSIGFMEWQSKKIAEEIKNIPKEGERLSALVDNLKSSSALMAKQGLTQVEQAKHLKELARRAVHEANLAKLDENAAVDSDNMGRNLNEYKLIIDSLRDLVPSNVLGKLFKRK